MAARPPIRNAKPRTKSHPHEFGIQGRPAAAHECVAVCSGRPLLSMSSPARVPQRTSESPNGSSARRIPTTMPIAARGQIADTYRRSADNLVGRTAAGGSVGCAVAAVASRDSIAVRFTALPSSWVALPPGCGATTVLLLPRMVWADRALGAGNQGVRAIRRPMSAVRPTRPPHGSMDGADAGRQSILGGRSQQTVTLRAWGFDVANCPARRRGLGRRRLGARGSSCRSASTCRRMAP